MTQFVHTICCSYIVKTPNADSPASRTHSSYGPHFITLLCWKSVLCQKCLLKTVCDYSSTKIPPETSVKEYFEKLCLVYSISYILPNLYLQLIDYIPWNEVLWRSVWKENMSFSYPIQHNYAIIRSTFWHFNFYEKRNVFRIQHLLGRNFRQSSSILPFVFKAFCVLFLLGFLIMLL